MNKTKQGYHATDQATAYLFAVGNAVQHADGAEGPTQGKMYFGKQFGFLYGLAPNQGQTVETAGRTLGHEICHGNYKLHHIFTNIFLNKGYEQYDNLMSYKPGATNLIKAQWDIIHDPGVIWGWAQSEEDGAYSTGGINENTLVFSGDNYQEITTRINKESVCYYNNTDRTKIKLDFKPIFEGKEDYPKTIYVKTEVKYDGQIINNTEEVHKAGKDKESGGYASKKSFSFELENKIDRYNNISIICYWSTDGESNWQQVMEYSPIIYTTFREAANDQYGRKCNLDEHLLYFTCNLSPDYSETGTFNAIWSKIEDLNLNTNDFSLNTNLSIGYYTLHEVSSFVSLMEHNSGVCNAFQDLMVKALQTQGLSAINASISMGSDEGFLVKAWKYRATGTSGNIDYPYINYFDLNSYEPPYLSGKYRWTGTPEVERMPNDANNLGDQNNNKPPANFYIHQVVEYNGRIYDPSYGKSFDNIEKWKEQCIDGVYIDGGIKMLENGTEVNSWIIKKY